MTKILVLPDAGPQNPFQYQMIDLLKKNGYQVIKAPRRRFFATLSAFDKYQPDIVYFDWIQSFILGKTLVLTLVKCVCFFLELQYISRIKKKPILHTLHNMHNHAKRWLWIERQIYTYFLKKCYRIRVYSQTTKDKVVNIFKVNPDKIHIIEDVPFHLYYPNTVTREESRKFLNIPAQQYVYLFQGMIKPYKGIDDLLSAFKQMYSKDDMLIIAGPTDNPEYVSQLQTMAKDLSAHIRFVNEFIPIQHIQYYFNAANVVVLPFKNIEHSSSIDLAMSFAKPIITLRTEFLAALLPHQFGLLFTTIDDLKEKMITVKTIDEQFVGRRNFLIADNSNYKEFLSFFDLNGQLKKQNKYILK
ncbi:glycosyltransferase family 4 protein [Rhodocytophaga aerolata]|uniref:Glycosyltransferase family 4 protein n=1 Tax=Rhodocytophaga aerolata TaxID=455078 RepID=A0ABT8R4B4_9BACT|nr:glycosyltransferase family 4 protein [Rhodocytophaga aerolata]MDO1446945.1 glycosyltransferase family 4 protein [Rhodocytophaga aerolata]